MLKAKSAQESFYGNYLYDKIVPQDHLTRPSYLTTQRLDSTGLYYYNARYYDPQIGRFISPEATVQDLNNPQTQNRDSYSINNPLKYVDPSGNEQVYVTNEGLNDNGVFWYCVYSDKDHNNIISIVTGADDLASRYSDFIIDNDFKSITQQSNTPAQFASFYANSSGSSTKWVFYGGSDFGINLPIISNNNSSKALTWLALGFMFWAEFQEASNDVGGGSVAPPEFGNNDRDALKLLAQEAKGGKPISQSNAETLWQ